MRPTTLWMIALWVNLAATLRVSLGWLDRRWFAAGLLGALGGPIAYGAGANLGAIEFAQPVVSLAAIAGQWLVAMPVLVWIAGRPERASAPALAAEGGQP